MFSFSNYAIYYWQKGEALRGNSSTLLSMRKIKRIKQAKCTLCPDMILTYTGGTSNLIHNLEAKHSVEYSQGKNSEADETNKPSMKH